MNEKFLRYYEKYNPNGVFFFLIKAIFCLNKLKKLSLIHRQKDYISLAEKPELLTLHYKINKQLLKGTLEWDSYDYGEGYFYQSFSKVGI